jgi:Asp-tRNA(Asn)/Glu-tRNA(Gln) amidotransferase A subunit family amidase
MELPFQGRDPGPQSERTKTTRPGPSRRLSASVPTGLSCGLPVGIRLILRRYADADAPAADAAVERLRPWSPAYRVGAERPL